MKRLYEPAAYGPQPGCYWHDTISPPAWPQHQGATSTEVAIIGAGFTGLSAALHLAEAGIDTTVLEAEHPGWGASGRNGGFCCLGGAAAPDALLTRRFGAEAAANWHKTEAAAIDTVAELIDRLNLQVDRHSDGETMLAHSARAWRTMQAEDHGPAARLIPRDALRQHGLAGPWFGALTKPKGFALNPAKYLDGLAKAAAQAGARLYAQSPVTKLHRADANWHLTTSKGTVTANTVILATNGYSAEDLPDWMRARTLPVQSSVIVTRPITPEEQAKAGWTSSQMSYDSRTLLHYFRLMPNGRFLFGMRGGIRATPRARAAISAKIRADFWRLFPAWRDVEITHEWSGLVCFLSNLTPFAGPVPGHDGLFAGLGYHGNGVAMASHTGRNLADLVQGKTPRNYPAVMQAAPKRFPLGRFRRALLLPSYALAETFDL